MPPLGKSAVMGARSFTGTVSAVRIRYGALGPAALCRRGLRQVYRLRPKRPGDEPHAKSEVLAVTLSKSRPKRLIKVRTTMLNQNGEAVQVQAAISSCRTATDGTSFRPRTVSTDATAQL